MKLIFISVFVVCSVLVISGITSVYSEKMNVSTEASLDIEISYPDMTFPDRKFPLSIFVKNNGWENKNNVTFVIQNEDSEIIPLGQSKFVIDSISAGGSHGQTIDLHVGKYSTAGKHFVNIIYSQVLMKNNEEAQPPVQRNIAIPVIVKEKPDVFIHTTTPESIFTNAEFPFDIEIISKDVAIKNAELEILVPRDINFRGETKHMFSSITKNEPVAVSARIITPDKEINTEYKIPFQINFRYTDDVDNEQKYSQVIQMTLRPRTFMEITNDGGLWIGNVFVAPYVSLGTVIGIPAGAILSIMLRRTQKKKSHKDSKTKNKIKNNFQSFI